MFFKKQQKLSVLSLKNLERTGLSSHASRYDRFIEELGGYDARQFDAYHILIPPMTKAELEKLAGKLC